MKAQLWSHPRSTPLFMRVVRVKKQQVQLDPLWTTCRHWWLIPTTLGLLAHGSPKLIYVDGNSQELVKPRKVQLIMLWLHHPQLEPPLMLWWLVETVGLLAHGSPKLIYVDGNGPKVLLPLRIVCCGFFLKCMCAYCLKGDHTKNTPPAHQDNAEASGANDTALEHPEPTQVPIPKPFSLSQKKNHNPPAIPLCPGC